MPTAPPPAYQAFPLLPAARNMPAADATRFFVEGGDIPIERFVALYRLSVEDAAAQLVKEPLLRGTDPDALMDPGRIDIIVDRVLAQRLRGALMVAIGPEPVIGYVYARRAEITTVRMLLIGKLAGVGAELLHSRLRGVR